MAGRTSTSSSSARPRSSATGTSSPAGSSGGRSPTAAAIRELREETGLEGEPRALGGPLDYDLAGDPESVRERFPPGTERIVVWVFVVDAPPGWEPVLDEEHVDHRWLDAAAAVALLHYPEPREAVRLAASS